MNARLSKFNQKEHSKIPIYAAAADVPAGTVLKVGVTAGTDLGAAIVSTGNSDQPGIMGVLNEQLDYSVDGETLQNGTDFLVKHVSLAFKEPVFELEFDQDDVITVASNSGTTLTITSLEDNIDASFVYVVSGTGAGQLQYLTASAAGSATLKAAFGTTLDTTSRVIKILRRFHALVSLNSAGTKLSNQAAVGAVNARIMDIRMVRNSEKEDQLDPEVHPGISGLSSRTKFVADVMWLTTAAYTID
jgi:hypothetical protein